MLDIAVAAAFQLILGHTELAQVLRRVGHEPVRQGLVNDVVDLLGLGAEDGGAGDDHLLPHANEQVRLGPEQGVDQVEVLDDDPLALVEGLGDGVGQDAHLREAVLKADIHMVGVGGEEAEAGVLLQQGQGPHIDAGVGVGQVQAREHAPDQGALAGPGLPDDANELVKGGQVQLHQLHPQLVHALVAAGGEVGTDDVACLAVVHIFLAGPGRAAPALHYSASGPL